MNILIVDDDQVDRSLIKRSLRKSQKQHDIKEVDSAINALLLLKQCQFDVVLLDYQMPEMNGIEMVAKLRSHKVKNSPAIVMLSNCNSEELLLSCINAGAQDFILKSEVTTNLISRALIQAKKRFELEHQLYDSYCQVKQMAEKDSLTGLSNRYHFDENLKQAIISNTREDKNLAVMVLDVDHFKNINDTFGHEIGDKLLVKVSERIKSVLREGQICARLGGDEFSFIFTQLSHIHLAHKISERILSVFDELITIDDHDIHCSASLGIALHPINGQTGEELIKFADIAMYRAKNLGRNQACLFEDNMQKEFYRKYQIELELRKALVNDGFILNFQPITDAITGKMKGVEALIRWPTAVTSKRPDEFIMVAEQSRIIEPLGRWIINSAIKQLALLQAHLGQDFYMGINLSPYQLNNIELAEFIVDSLQKHDVDAKSLVIEVTETVLLSDDENTALLLNCFKKLGMRIALDDFGTGYSSISHLLNYPIDIVKLDKSLIDGSQQQIKYARIMEGLVKMLKSVGITIVSEGVETSDQLETSRQFSVDLIQGFYYSKALNFNELIEYSLKKIH